MRATNRLLSRIMLATMLLAAAGCNVLSLPYFLFERASGGDSRLPAALLDLTPQDKHKVNRIVVVGYSGLVSEPDFVTADREIAGLVTRNLEDAYRDKAENVVFIPQKEVNKYKDNHTDWHVNLAGLGKHFDADYVIYLEVNSLTLYENKSFHQFFRGRTEIQVSVVDVHKPDEYVAQKDYHSEYPRGAPVQADDCSPQKFQRAFYGEVAKQLAWLFAPHDASEDFKLD